MTAPICTVGSEVLRARLARGLAQQKLAKELGISQQYLCDIEHDRRRPAWKIQYKIEPMLSLPRGHLSMVRFYCEIHKHLSEMLREN